MEQPSRLGATALDGATRFEVWAPAATVVEVGIATPSGAFTPHSLRPSRADGDREVVRDVLASTLGCWHGIVDGVGHGDRYCFRLGGGDWLADPASRWQPDGVHASSAVVDVSAFRWSDDGWPGIELDDAVLYEIHVGTFTAEGTFEAATAQLGRLAQLGVTLVEVMPVAAFPGTRNWGYDGVFPFAVQESYGGPSGLARFVDAAHEAGLGVVLDVVYNHFGPEGNIVDLYAPYLTDAYSTPWGGALNVAGPGSDGVRRYVVENACGWIEDYHIDGLRLDAVHAIVDPSPVPMLRELTAAVHERSASAGRTTLVTIESNANDPRIVRAVDQQGWGCDAVWNDDVHHALRVALTDERHEYYAAFTGVADLAAAWEQRWVYEGQHSTVFGRRHGAPADDIDPRHFVVFDQNHDHIGNTPRGNRLLANGAPLDPRLRLAAATILLSPFTPMLFMGEEYADPAPFPYFIDHGDPDLVAAVRTGRQAEFAGSDWSGGVADPADPATFRAAVLDPSLAVSSEPHRSMLALYTELLRLRRDVGVLTDPLATQRVTTVGDRDGRPVGMVVQRRSGDDGAATLVLNFGCEPLERPDPMTTGDIAFDSDDVRWGGSTGANDLAPGGPIAPWSARLVLNVSAPGF